MFWPLLVTLWLIPFVARTGLILHTVVFLYALAADELRMQPELMSPVILLWGTLFGTTTRDVARLHLGATWFYAGFHKLIAPRYRSQLGPYIMNGLWELGASENVAWSLSVLLAIAEMAIAVAILVPRTRKLARSARSSCTRSSSSASPSRRPSCGCCSKGMRTKPGRCWSAAN
ncbi:MAG: hypothetical protein QM811_28425 [Pirellulales bacterium]